MPLRPARIGRNARRVPGAARAAYVALNGAAHPTVDGRLDVNYLAAPVEVLRDRYGVPHIFAASAEDAFFGQGFVHAQDRLFQMDSMRQAASGRLAEWVGEAGIEADRFMRRLGFVDIAGRDLAATGDEERELLAAYARGVNEAVRTLPSLPPEYAFLGTTPEPWHPEHSMLLGRFVLFSFAGNWDTELLRERLLDALGPLSAAAVDPAYPAAGYTSTGAAAPAVERVLHSYEAALAAGLSSGGGSNAWAVTAERTTTGSPLLGSDPHLDSRMPGLLHVSHVVGGPYDVIGAGVAGIPVIAMGHNRDLAWGITAALADVSDCYIETINPTDPMRYLTPDGWAIGRTRIERIHVRGGETVEERVLETRHGPIISPTIIGETRAVALRSTAIEPGDPLAPVLELCRATTVEDFDQAVGKRPGVPFNYIYACSDGRIGYRMSGSIPRRSHGEGLLPADGARSPGPPPARPPEEMPHIVDPPEGLVANANNAPGGPHELGEEWCEPWRVERIVQLLRAQPRHSIASFQRIQTDTHSEALARLRDCVISADAVADSGLRALLEAWDGRLDADSVEAGVMSTVYQELAQGLAARVAGRHASTVLGAGLGLFGGGSFSYRLQGTVLRACELAAPPWFEDAHDRDRAMRAAFERATQRLTSRLGPDRRAWRWGDLHQWRLPHALEAVPVLGRRFSRGPYPFPGDTNTVLQAGYRIARGADNVGVLPGYRQIIDLADLDHSVFQLSTGNSGIPGHSRYGDSIDEFRAGQYRPLLYSRAAIERHLEHTLRLEPA